MEMPVTILTLLENYLVGVLLGASTLAVISYAISLRHGYPRSGVGHVLIQSIYTLIRLFHIFFAVLVSLYIIVFGFMDGTSAVWYEYGIKGAVLVMNAIVAFGMARRIFRVDYFAPVIAAGWYFLASYHSYTLHITTVAITGPLLWYFALVVLFQLVFFALRFFISPHVQQHGPADGRDGDEKLEHAGGAVVTAHADTVPVTEQS